MFHIPGFAKITGDTTLMTGQNNLKIRAFLLLFLRAAQAIFCGWNFMRRYQKLMEISPTMPGTTVNYVTGPPKNIGMLSLVFLLTTTALLLFRKYQLSAIVSIVASRGCACWTGSIIFSNPPSHK